MFSQISQSALLPSKKGEGKETGKDVYACREGKKPMSCKDLLCARKCAGALQLPTPPHPFISK